MIRATKVKPAGHWAEAAADTVVLEFDDRHRRRTVMNGVHGLAFLLDLPEAVALRGGDALVLEDDRIVEVVSAPEPLIEVRGKHPGDLVRLAWHVGNRHLPAQILPHALRLREDHVIADMLRKLGGKVTSIEAPFDPEGGAYAGGHAEAHGEHDHGEGKHHGHAHGHEHDHHAHDHGHRGHGRHDHEHGPDAGKHDHRDHEHGHHGHDRGGKRHKHHGKHDH